MKVFNYTKLFQQIRENLGPKLSQIDVMNKLLMGGGISAVGGISSKILTFVSVVYVSRQIGGENFGIYIYFQAALMFFCLLFSIGLPTPATKIAAEIYDNDKNKLKQIITLYYSATFLSGLIGTLLFILVGIFLFPENMSKNVFNYDFVLITSLAILCINLDALNHAFLFGLAEIKHSILALVLASILGLLSVVMLVELFGMYGAMLSIATVPAIQLLVSGYMCLKKLRADNLLSRKIDFSHSRTLLDQGLPMMLLGIMLALANWSVQTIIVYSGRGLEEVGVFGVGQQAFQLVVFVPIAFGRVLLPLLSKHLSINHLDVSTALIKMSFVLNFCIAFPVFLFIWILAGEFLTIFGNYDLEYTFVIRVMALAAFISAVISPIGAILIANSRYWLGFAMNLGWAMVYVLATLAMSDVGVLGVSYALLVAYCLHSIWTIGWYLLDKQ